MFYKNKIDAEIIRSGLNEIELNSYENKYNRKIDVDVLKEQKLSFMVECNNKYYNAVVFESHTTDRNTVLYAVYLKNLNGELILKDGGEIDMRSSRFTIFDLMGFSCFRHSKKSKDIKLLDWGKFNNLWEVKYE